MASLIGSPQGEPSQKKALARSPSGEESQQQDSEIIIPVCENCRFVLTTPALCEHLFVTSQGSAFMRFRRALDRGNVTEALSAACDLQLVGLAEALELTLLLADREDARYDRAALRWHARFAYETKNVDIRESVAVLALLTAIPANRLAASALAELFGRRRSLERCAEALVHWARTE